MKRKKGRQDFSKVIMMTIMGLAKEKETKTIKIINIEEIKRIMASLMENEGLMIEVIEELLNLLITKTWDLLKAGQDSRWNRIKTSKNRSRSGKGKLSHLVVKFPLKMLVISQKVLSQERYCKINTSLKLV